MKGRHFVSKLILKWCLGLRMGLWRIVITEYLLMEDMRINVFVIVIILGRPNKKYAQFKQRDCKGCKCLFEHHCPLRSEMGKHDTDQLRNPIRNPNCTAIGYWHCPLSDFCFSKVLTIILLFHLLDEDHDGRPITCDTEDESEDEYDG